MPVGWQFSPERVLYQFEDMALQITHARPHASLDTTHAPRVAAVMKPPRPASYTRDFTMMPR